jgi:DNA invertase Pin-like site-specific DNA recombinase
MKKVRCAIYTRKSSEEGLEQDFNSLDAQRDSCAAYVLSQASEGWVLLADQYDDGGLSGGSLERPALQRLLTDVAAGKIDIVIVYKLDRLTRSLLDFAKLVDALEKADTSFVSVTQSFNTTTSMGRLTLNMLLSFAQFEREVTAERIRDKIAASKAKGMWMGGTPPLGYEPNGRSLAIVEEHAEIVRDIYRRYLALGNVRLVAAGLARDRIRAPERISRVGRKFGGRRFSKGNLYAILKNPIYIGEIRHRDQTHAGQHPGIVDRETWHEAQERLSANLRGERRARAAIGSSLAGIVFDEAGEPLIPVHACKGKVRYRYYVSRTLQHGEANECRTGIRIPARELEGVAVELIAQLLNDPPSIAAALQLQQPDIKGMMARSATIVDELRVRASELATFVGEVRVLSDRIEIDVWTKSIAYAVDVSAPVSPAVITLSAAVRLRRTGRVIRFVHPGGRSWSLPRSQTGLIKLAAKGNCWWKQLAQGHRNVTELARSEGVTPSYVTRIVRLAFLGPAVVESFLEGCHRLDVTCTDLMITGDFPALWSAQVRRLIGWDADADSPKALDAKRGDREGPSSIALEADPL